MEPPAVRNGKENMEELEQLAPYLLGNAAGNCSSTIYLEATPPAN